MRPGQQQNKRMRGRGRKGPNPLSRSYESNGPDVKIRGTAQHVAEKYSTLARDAAASGDRVMAENYLQHAEHYGRIVAAAQGTFQLQQDDGDFGDQNDEDGDDDASEGGYANEPAYQQPQPVRVSQDRPPQDRNGFERPQGERNNQPVLRDNRDAQPPHGSGNGNRDGQPRDGNRDGRLNNRDNRELRTGNRDGNREPNRDGRDNNKGSFQNRETQGREQPGRENQNRDTQSREPRERPAAVGLGPQPFLPDPAQTAAEAAGPDLRREDTAREQPQHPAATAGSGQDEFRPRPDMPRAEGEPRRRGRPRRVRPDDVVGSYGAVASSGPQASLPVGTAPAPQAPAQPAAEPRPASDATASSPETRTLVPSVSEAAAVDPEAKVKRKPGRPRKKKPEDDGPDGSGGDHMPAFLLASNG